MKKLLFIVVFVLSSLASFSQTFTLSSSTPGQTVQNYTVAIPQGNGYSYYYSATATNSTVVIVSYYRGTIAWLSNPTANQQQTSGSGNIGGNGNSKQYQDGIVIVVANGSSYCYGYGQISVNPY